MATQKDYYNLLGVPRDATEEQIRRAFRGLAMEWHPDRNKAKDAAARFKEINEAYQVLIDPEKRRTYDRYGRADIDPNGGFPAEGSTGSTSPAASATSSTPSSAGSADRPTHRPRGGTCSTP